MTNSLISDEDIFTLFGTPDNSTDHLQSIGRWFTRNPQTHFRYIQVQLKDQRSKLNLDLLKTLYPKVRFVTTVDNPWCRLYHMHNIHPKFSKMALEHFVKFISLWPAYCRNLIDLYPPDKSIIFLRNEYIDNDFSKFSNLSNVDIFSETDLIDYRTFFDSESDNIVLRIFQKDIEFFYPELLD